MKYINSIRFFTDKLKPHGEKEAPSIPPFGQAVLFKRQGKLLVIDPLAKVREVTDEDIINMLLSRSYG